MDVKLLGIYLNDHLAGSAAGLEVARRAEQENRGNPLGDFLSILITELEQDRAALEKVMHTLKVPFNPFKQGAAWMLERVGRLKLNGRIVRYSPLSRMVELEGLCLGTQGRRSMWRVLRRLARTEQHLSDFDFEALVARAEMQQKVLERWRLHAADTAFSNAQILPGTFFPAQGHGR